MQIKNVQHLFIILALLPAGVVFNPNEAKALIANCSVASGTMTFSGGDIISGSPVNGSATVNVTCNFLVSITGISVCLSIDAGTGGATSGVRHMLNGTQKLNYRLFSDAALSSPWGTASDTSLGSVIPVTVPAPFLLGSTTVPVTIYGQLGGSQTQAALGSYISTLNISAQYPTINAPILSDCGIIGNYAPTSKSASLTAQTTLQKACTVNTTDINFGSYAILNSNINATGRVNVTCTTATPYSIGLEAGSLTATTRRMKNGVDFVTYGLYQDAAYQRPWGTVASAQAKLGTGTGLTEVHTVYGRVPPQQTPPIKTYNDSVAVTITY